MKVKYLSINNCSALLPPIYKISDIQIFDDYLDELNSHPSHKKIINKLISRNQYTQDYKVWDRLYEYDIDVCFIRDVQKNQIRLSIQDYAAYPGGARVGANKRVEAQFSNLFPNGTRFTCRVPLQFLLKGWGNADDGYQGYVHTIKKGSSVIDGSQVGLLKENESCYVGITGRNWFKRFSEHMRDSFGGSQRLFHRAWQESYGESGMVYISSLQMINLSFEEAMEWEERYVDRWSLSPKGLNMIPGGFKGMRYLHQHRITSREIVSLEERDAAIKEFVRQNPRKGIPNPFMSELWEDDEFYLRVIEAKANTLNAEQVRKIRLLADMGRSIPDIVNEVGAANEAQVKNIILRKTYKRIH